MATNPPKGDGHRNGQVTECGEPRERAQVWAMGLARVEPRDWPGLGHAAARFRAGGMSGLRGQADWCSWRRRLSPVRTKVRLRWTRRSVMAEAMALSLAKVLSHSP